MISEQIELIKIYTHYKIYKLERTIITMNHKASKIEYIKTDLNGYIIETSENLNKIKKSTRKTININKRIVEMTTNEKYFKFEV